MITYNAWVAIEAIDDTTGNASDAEYLPYCIVHGALSPKILLEELCTMAPDIYDQVDWENDIFCMRAAARDVYCQNMKAGLGKGA